MTSQAVEDNDAAGLVINRIIAEEQKYQLECEERARRQRALKMEEDRQARLAIEARARLERIFEGEEMNSLQRSTMWCVNILRQERLVEERLNRLVEERVVAIRRQTDEDEEMEMETEQDEEMARWLEEEAKLKREIEEEAKST